MPNTQSAKKRQRQNLKRRVRNRSVRSSVKLQVRKVREEATAGKLAEGEADARVAAKKLDQAAAKGIIHRNTASRLKSRLSSALRSAKQKQK